MYNQKQSKVSTKVSRKKMNNKVETLVKKSVELSTQHNCNILLIIYSQDTNHWTQYCNTVSSSLFFGFQSAKEHLERIEEYDNSNYHKVINQINSSRESSISPKPVKHIKNYDESFTTLQPIKVADKSNDFVRSTISTEFTLSTQPVDLPPKTKDPPELNSQLFSLPNKKNLNENDSSSDFDFESYFVINSS